MGNKILEKRKLADNTFLMRVSAPNIAKNSQPGQFVILRLHEKGERIPLTIADNKKKEITLVFLACGKTTNELAKMKKGDEILDFAGPLGHETAIQKYGSVCLVGGGLGVAPLYLVAEAMKKEGNEVIIIIGARNKKLLFWEKELEKVSDKLIICTDDGSKGEKGFVTDALDKLLNKKHLGLVYAVGPPIMMKAVSETTYQRAKTIASLNSIMIDGIGMCGGCRVKVEGESRFSCVDGPEFDAHQVNWKELLRRNSCYKEEEDHVCKCL